MTVRASASFVLLLLSPLAALTAHAARPPALRWERLAVTRALPSQVFARLGIGHITRRGYTRDGAKKTDPDPTFPPGLTDVVPLDAEHLLLARGTSAGLAAFKQQVTQAEGQVTAVRWHVSAQLVQAQNGVVVPVGAGAASDAPDSVPIVLMLGQGSNRPYQIRVLPAPLGALQVAWQRGLMLSHSLAARGVLTPDVAWSAGVSRTLPPGGSVTFDDLASDRLSAREALGLPAEKSGVDYGVRLTITSLNAPALAAPSPAAPIPAAP